MALFVIYLFFWHVKETLRFSLTRHRSTWWTVGGARTTWVRETKFGTASLERSTSTNCTTGYLVICTTFLLLRERCDALPWNAKRPLFTDTRLRNMVALPVWFSNPLSSQTVAGGAKHHQTSDYLTFLFSFYVNIYNQFYFWDHEYFFSFITDAYLEMFSYPEVNGLSSSEGHTGVWGPFNGWYKRII